MKAYALQRIIALIPVLLIASLVIFTIVRLAPGGPAAVILGEQATAPQIDALNHKLGLDQPLYVQFAKWVRDVFTGNLGESLFYNGSVTSVIGQHIQPTLLLSTYAILLAIIIGVPIGTIAALRHGSLLDRGLMSVSLIGVAAPSFLIALILIIVAAVKFHFLPSGGYVRIQSSFFGNLKSLILPAISLSLGSLALIARITRSAVLEVLGSDYVRTAHAKGLKNRTVVVRHILRSALLNVITIIGLVFAGLMGGTVVIETVFHIPGIGSLIIHAVIRRDFPLVQGTILYITFAVVLVNLVVDLLYAWIDPRVNV